MNGRTAKFLRHVWSQHSYSGFGMPLVNDFGCGSPLRKLEAREGNSTGFEMLFGCGAFQQARVRWRIQFLTLAKRLRMLLPQELRMQTARRQISDSEKPQRFGGESEELNYTSSSNLRYPFILLWSVITVMFWLRNARAGGEFGHTRWWYFSKAG